MSSSLNDRKSGFIELRSCKTHSWYVLVPPTAGFHCEPNLGASLVAVAFIQEKVTRRKSHWPQQDRKKKKPIRGKEPCFFLQHDVIKTIGGIFEASAFMTAMKISVCV